MKRLGTFLLLSAVALMAFAPVALADSANDHGQGWFGETSDLDVTIAGFIVIGGFPLFILLASLLMWRLEKRKDDRKAVDKERMAHADERGGW